MSALDDVLGAIARAVGPDSSPTTRLGAVTLRPQQADAVARVRSALATFGGALLADAPGLGKTYVALGVAASYPTCLVAAPAALRGMWAASAARAGVTIDFVSLEALSRDARTVPSRFVIVDEAHRVANPAARRYARVAALAHHAHVLLVTATPVRNRRAEWAALLGIFLGPDADLDDESLVERCVIRRDATGDGDVPSVRIEAPIVRRHGAEIATALRSLPPPLALADGASAAGFVATVLARCWSSSLSALDAALTRRLQRGAALTDMLTAGRLPSTSELRAWIVGDDGMQIAFPFLARETSPASVPSCRAALERHVRALEALREFVHARVPADTAWRVRKLRDLRARHHPAVIVAFTAFDATARTLYSALRRDPGVALLTGHGAETAGGPVPRGDILAALAAPADGASVAPRVFDIRLLIATDLLSEGANLQRASVIVHLDDPWTPAAAEQRIGRAARLGSRHREVFVHRFGPGPAVRGLLALDRLHQAKRTTAARALATTHATERLRTLATSWRTDGAIVPGAVVAACPADRDGFVAVVYVERVVCIVGGTRDTRHAWGVTDDAARICRLLRAVRLTDASRPQSTDITPITRAVHRWVAQRGARRRAGLERVPSQVRRRILGRLDRFVSQAGSARRAVVAPRAGRVRDMLASVRGAHVERIIERALGAPFDDHWLDAVELMMTGLSPTGRGPEGASAPDAEITALLVLRRES